MNNFCNCFDDEEEGGEHLLPNVASSTSPLSKTFADESCFLRESGRSNAVGIEDIGDCETEREEVVALGETIGKLNINERNSAENTLRGNFTRGLLLNNCHGELYEEPQLKKQILMKLASTIQRIEKELNEANKRDGDFEAYAKARTQNPTYVSHELFTIGFLRAERYDPEKSARRIFRYFRIKLDLFGEEKLTHDILLEDLGEDGMAYLETGGLQVLPQRDESGRRVVFGVGILQGSGDQDRVLSARKAYFYFWSSVYEDDDDMGKIKGIVGIMWRVHKPPLPNFAAANELRKIWQAVPLRISGYHMCYAPQIFDRFVKMTLPWFMNKHDMRYRRAHFNTAVNIMYTMKFEFGIPTEVFPISPESNKPILYSQSQNHMIWLEHRIKLDRDKREVMNSIVSSNGTISIDPLLNSLRTSNGSLSMEHSFGSLSESNEFSIRPDDTLIGGPSTANGGVVGVINSLLASGTSDDDFELIDQAIDESQLVSESLMVSESLATSITSTSITEGDIAERDIKFGRGKPLQRHPGNIWFRKLISDQFQKYESLDKRRQTEFTLEIITVVRKNGRKFWKQENGRWEEVGDNVAREKAAITFRTERKKRKIALDRRNR